jgi:hypothetical protein
MVFSVGIMPINVKQVPLFALCRGEVPSRFGGQQKCRGERTEFGIS